MAIENLIENTDSRIIKIRTKRLDVSFNELYDMYKNKELFDSVIGFKGFRTNLSV